jgi:hypothetical protein
MVASAGDAPSERTLQRHFAREDLTTPRGSTVFGRLLSVCEVAYERACLRH